MTDDPPNRVTVTDIEMPFLSMVRFMVKWAIAAIPALLILVVLGVVFWTVVIEIPPLLKSTFPPKLVENPQSAKPSSPSVATAPSTDKSPSSRDEGMALSAEERASLKKLAQETGTPIEQLTKEMGSAPVKTSPTPVVSSSAIDATVATYLSNVAVRKVEVSETTSGHIGVFGEVKNIGARTLKEVEITVYCLGADEKPVYEEKFYPIHVSEVSYGDSNKLLKPGYSEKFGYKMDGAPSDWSKKVDVKVTGVQFE